MKWGSALLIFTAFFFLMFPAAISADTADVETPTGSIDGPLDPAPPEAQLLLRNGLTNRWQLFTMDGLTVTSSGEVALPISANIQPVGRADLDGDAIGDVLLCNEGSSSKAGQFQSYLLDGQTITDNAVLNTIKDLDYAVISNDDFGGDSKGDLLLRNSAGAWLMYEIDGVTALGFGVPALPTDTALVPRATGDFNGDQRADVLMRRGDGVWELFLMDAQLSIDNGEPALPTLSVWEILAVEDYNADNKADLLMRRSDTGLWKLFLMDGTTVLEERQVIRNYKPLNFDFKSAEDFDGDGRADILIRNVNNGIWRLFLMDGTAIIGNGTVDLLRSARYVFVHAQDLNNDGKADVILRKDDGRWHATLMDGINPKIDSDFVVLQKDLNWFLVTAVNDPPVITGQVPLSTSEETPLTITLADLTVSDPDNVYPDEFTLTVLPGAGYTLTGPSQITPVADFAGTLSVPVTVNDGTDDSVPFDLLVTVTAVNDPPVITGQVPLSTLEETPLTLTLGDLTVSDPDNVYPDEFTLTVLPGAGYTLTGPSQITPVADFAGTLSVPVTVNDGTDDSAAFDLLVTVTAVNDPPVITGQVPLSTLEETPLTLTLGDLTVSDPDNVYPDEFTLTVLPGAGYTLTGPSQITPVADFAGTLSVPVTVNDGTDDSVPFDLLVTVTAVNDPPVITGQVPLSTLEETPLTLTLGDLTVSDPDNVYPDEFTLTVLPGAGYTLTGPSQITPVADFAGTLSVPVTVNDGTDDSVPFDLLVTVTAVNDPPVITGQVPLSTLEETPLTLTLGDLTVSDPDNVYPDEFTLTVLPGAGYTLTGPSQITPVADFAGTLSVPVTVNDGTDDSVPFDLLVTVTAVNDPPVITGQVPLSTLEETPLTLTLGDLTVSDPDNVYPDEFTLTVLPGAGYTLTGPSQITPESDFTGDLSVPVTVNDGTDDSAPFDLLVTVESTTPPNIVMIMLDDLDERTLQDALLAGLMPNLQTYIVDGALEFTESYVTNPLCCPSRASFLSGLYSHNHGAVHNVLLYPGRGHLGAVGVFDDSDTIATRMQSLGYTTGHIGKYLNGYGRYPLDADISPAFEQSYVPPGWNEWHTTVDPTTYCVYNYKINHNGVVTSYDLPQGQTESSELYQIRVIADLAESFVETHGSGPAPFFLAIMPITPHWESCSDAYGGQPLPDDLFARRIRPAPEDLSAPVPAFVPSPAYNEDTSDKPDFLATLPTLTATDLSNLTEQYQVRVRSLISVDRLIGRLIAALGSAVGDTVLIFTSDNGWLYGDYRQGGKIYAYDASAKVPLYIRMPGSTVAEQRGNLVINNDLAPTILNMATPGYPDTDFDGRTFAPLLANPQPPGWIDRSHFLIEHLRTSNAPVEDVYPSYFALRNLTTLYIETIGGTYTAPGSVIGLELYDVVSDPYHLQSLIRHPQDPPDPVLNGYLEALKTCIGQACKDSENAAQ